MHRRTLALLCVVTLIAAVPLACTSSKNPAAPTAPPADTSGASTDGAGLKVSAPTSLSPNNDQRLADLSATTLTASAAIGQYATATGIQYDFEVYNASNVKIQTSVVSSPSLKLASDLEANKRYTWRVHAALPSEKAYGPWSAFASFLTPDNSSYFRGSEIYDSLIDGKTLGVIHGPVTFIPGVGVRLETTLSYIHYVLPQTLTEGEFSLIVTNLSRSTPGTEKAKVMGMAQGFDDIVTNERRFTFEKRADGTIAWRLITHDDQIDTGPAERQIYGFHDELTYFWQATWRANRFTATVKEGAAGGNGQDKTVYNISDSWAGRPYDPTPHVIYVGNPVGRSGDLSASIPGIIVRQVWVSANPRPAFANK